MNDLLLSTKKVFAEMGKKGSKLLYSPLLNQNWCSCYKSHWILSSWQVMVAIVFAQMLYEMLADNEIQDWCEQTVFGIKSKNHNTMYLSARDRSALVQKQEKMLHIAMQIVFNLPLSEKEIKKSEDERRKRQQDINNHYRLKY